jgi:hypothetical protein
MRRGLAFTSLFLLLAGLELSTEALTLVISRVRSGLGSILAGTEFHVSPFRFAVGMVAMLVGVTLWSLLVWSASRRKDVASVGTNCPQCGNRTRRVKRKESQRVLSAILGERLTRRRCETCGWSGLSLRH